MEHPSELESAVAAALARVTDARTLIQQKPFSIQDLKATLDEAVDILGRLQLNTALLKGPPVFSRTLSKQRQAIVDRIIQEQPRTASPRTGQRLSAVPDSQRWALNTFTMFDSDITDINYSMTQLARATSQEIHASGSELGGSIPISMSLNESTIETLENFQDHSFDFLNLSATLAADQRQIPVFANYVIESIGGLDAMQPWIDDAAVFHRAYLRYLGEIDKRYSPKVLYHNATHAVDVMATVERLMRSQYMQARTGMLDRLLVLTTAAVHDVGHRGRDNLFHMRTMGPLALRYNDRSILESMHAAEAFNILQTEQLKCNWLTLLVDGPPDSESRKQNRKKVQQYVRKAMIRMILGTDMAKNEQFMKALANFIEQEGEQTSEGGESSVLNVVDLGEIREEALERKLFLLEAVMHTADLAGPTKPRYIMLVLSQRILHEFWEQGCEEQELGLEMSPLCDRGKGKLVVPSSQLFFSAKIVLPLWRQVSVLIEEAEECEKQLEENIQFWQEKDAEKATYEQLFPDHLFPAPRECLERLETRTTVKTITTVKSSADSAS